MPPDCRYSYEQPYRPLVLSRNSNAASTSRRTCCLSLDVQFGSSDCCRASSLALKTSRQVHELRSVFTAAQIRDTVLVRSQVMNKVRALTKKFEHCDTGISFTLLASSYRDSTRCASHSALLRSLCARTKGSRIVNSKISTTESTWDWHRKRKCCHRVLEL